MEGPDINDQEMKGIIPRMMDALFIGLVNASSSTEFTIKVSFLEIYMERIQDLLDETKANLQVKEDKGRGIYIQDATEVFVSSPAEMMAVMKTGSSNRSVAATRMNERSSRSHSIFIVHIDQKDVETGTRKSGKLHFVDLAGSEKVGKTNVSGQQLEEAKMINKSLSALGMVINALTERQSFVPYRDSKLTRLLQESLGGNSQTTLVIACSMSSYNDVETLGTLRFGQRAKKIQNKPVVNQERSAKELLIKLEQAEKEIAKQAEVLQRLQAHIQQKYANHPTLTQEIATIIANSYQPVQCEEPEVKHEPSLQVSPAQSLTLLKQHIEIVRLNEELQKIKLEKQDLDTELTQRRRDEQGLRLLNAELETSARDEIGELRVRLEATQASLEKSLISDQKHVADMNKIRNAIYRLQADLLIVEKDLTGGKVRIQGMDIFQQSLAETQAVFSGIQWAQEENTQWNSRSLTEIEEESPMTDRELEFRSLLTRTSDLEEAKSSLSTRFFAKQSKYKALKMTVKTMRKELEMALEERGSLEEQVKCLQEEKAQIELEMEEKDLQIEDLKQEMATERQRFEAILAVDSPKRLVKESEERIMELQLERKKVLFKQLYDEIVAMRRLLDHKDEDLLNWRTKYERLERNLTPLMHKQTSERPAGPRASVPADTAAVLKNIAKPIRGGGGDVWSFKKVNQETMALHTEPAREMPQELLKSRVTRLKQSRSNSGFGAMFGGFLSKLI
jgi:kinesin family protein 5